MLHACDSHQPYSQVAITIVFTHLTERCEFAGNTPAHHRQHSTGGTESKGESTFLLQSLRARLSLPTFSSSVTRLSYGASPATSRTTSRMNLTRLLRRYSPGMNIFSLVSFQSGVESCKTSSDTAHPLALRWTRLLLKDGCDVSLVEARGQPCPCFLRHDCTRCRCAAVPGAVKTSRRQDKSLGALRYRLQRASRP